MGRMGNGDSDEEVQRNAQDGNPGDGYAETQGVAQA
jgi:hypothetical protein